MLYLYDNAIAVDLRNSFDASNISPLVKIIDPDAAIPIYAQLQDDDLHFPIVTVARSADHQIDTSLSNFTRIHRGVANVFDPETNLMYNEKAIPIILRYTISILGDNTVDVDELERELIFKYTDMYFLSINLPYESNRRMRFGIEIDRNDTIDRSSGFLENLTEGKLYASNIPMVCQGAVLLSYTPVKLRNVDYEIHAYTRDQMDSIQ